MFPKSIRFRHRNACAAAISLLVALSVSPDSHAQRFDNPQVDGMPMDQCLGFAVDCGETAADYFCGTNGYTDAQDWGIENSPSDTKTLKTKEICDTSQWICDKFSFIECAPDTNANREVTNDNGIVQFENGSITVLDIENDNPIPNVTVTLIEGEPTNLILVEDSSGRYESRIFFIDSQTDVSIQSFSALDGIVVRMNKIGREIQIFREEFSIDDLRNTLNAIPFVDHYGELTKDQIDASLWLASGVLIANSLVTGGTSTVASAYVGGIAFVSGALEQIGGVSPQFKFDVYHLKLYNKFVLIPVGVELSVIIGNPTDNAITSDRIVNVTGVISGDPNLRSATLVHNADETTISVREDMGFSQEVSLAEGMNTIRVVADPTIFNRPLLGLILGRTSTTTHVIYEPPISSNEGYRVVLNWDNPNTDLDLHVWDSNGYHTFYFQSNGIPNSSLDIDDRCGPGAETFVLSPLLAGTSYVIGVKYYAANNQGSTPFTIRVYNDLSPLTVPTVFSGVLNNTDDSQIITTFPFGIPSFSVNWESVGVDDNFCDSAEANILSLPEQSQDLKP